MDLAALITFAVSLLGAGGFLQFMITRHDNLKKDEILRKLEQSRIESEKRAKKLHKRIDELEFCVTESRLDRTRSQLLILLYHNPKNIDTIISVATTYFIKLKGDGWMYNELKDWADEQGVDITFITDFHNKMWGTKY